MKLGRCAQTLCSIFLHTTGCPIRDLNSGIVGGRRMQKRDLRSCSRSLHAGQFAVNPLASRAGVATDLSKAFPAKHQDWC